MFEKIRTPQITGPTPEDYQAPASGAHVQRVVGPDLGEK